MVSLLYVLRLLIIAAVDDAFVVIFTCRHAECYPCDAHDCCTMQYAQNYEKKCISFYVRGRWSGYWKYVFCILGVEDTSEWHFIANWINSTLKFNYRPLYFCAIRNWNDTQMNESFAKCCLIIPFLASWRCQLKMLSSPHWQHTHQKLVAHLIWSVTG